MLTDLDERVTFVGRLRGDAAVYDPRVPAAKKGQRGRKAQKGPRPAQPEGGRGQGRPQALGDGGTGCGRKWR
jgi:hypothetical protein